MCTKCDQLEERLNEESRRRITPKAWWGGIISAIVTILIFTVTTIFATGKVASQIEEHIKGDPTYQELAKEFVDKDAFKEYKEGTEKKLDLIIKMLEKK